MNPNVLFDPDNVSDGTAEWSCGPSDWSAVIGENACPESLEDQEVFFGVPHPPPGGALRADRPRGDGSFDALRVPMMRPAGQHGIFNAQPFRVFDADAYMVDFTARFLGSAGTRVEHEAGCDCSATDMPPLYLDGEERLSALGDRACTPDDLRLCDPSCAEAWGIVTPSEATCTP